ncbi:hypothetical protein [Serratia sp. (in: enterobacteria)]|uniref:hypothetical protein n=1 Tax=Serratia sp. (in: enterobacteria) TaxID=616 RepID=UPI003989EED3
MTVSESARIRELLRTFEYSGAMSREELVVIQVPSSYFPDEKSLDKALEDAEDKDLIAFDKAANKYYLPQSI